MQSPPMLPVWSAASTWSRCMPVAPRWRRIAALLAVLAVVGFAGGGVLAAPAQAADTPALAANPNPSQLEQAQDPFRAYQWALTRMSFESTWATYTSGSGVTVAVLDTGVDAAHPEFAGQLVTGYDCAQGPVEQPSTTCTETNFMSDQDGHGTMSAGYIAAKANNGQGLAGAAPGVKIMPIRIMKALPDYTTLAQQLPTWIATNDPRLQQFTTLGQRLSSAIRYAVDHGASVISMSFGLCFDDYALFRQVAECVPGFLRDSVGYGLFASAIEYARAHDVVMVAAAGNNGIDDMNGLEIAPTSWNGVLGAGAIDRDLKRLSYSNAGPMVDFVAPGTDLYTTERSTVNWGIGAGYRWDGRGTSAAAPYTAAAAALVRAANPSLSAVQVASILASTAQDLGVAGRDNVYGAGLPNPWSAVRKARGLDPGVNPQGINITMNPAYGTRPFDDQDLTITIRSATESRSVVLDSDPSSTTPDTRSLNDLTPGEYVVSVSRPRLGTALAGFTCTTGVTNVFERTARVTVQESGMLSCELATQTSGSGTVRVQLSTPAPLANDFVFSLVGKKLTLDTDADPVRSSRGTFTAVPLGYRSLRVPAPPTGYAYRSVTCTSGGIVNSTFNAATRTVTVLVTNGSVSSCAVRLRRA